MIREPCSSVRKATPAVDMERLKRTSLMLCTSVRHVPSQEIFGWVGGGPRGEEGRGTYLVPLAEMEYGST